MGAVGRLHRTSSSSLPSSGVCGRVVELGAGCVGGADLRVLSGVGRWEAVGAFASVASSSVEASVESSAAAISAADRGRWIRFRRFVCTYTSSSHKRTVALGGGGFKFAGEKGADGSYGRFCWSRDAASSGCAGRTTLGHFDGSVAAEGSVYSVGHYCGWIGTETYYPGTWRGRCETWVRGNRGFRVEARYWWRFGAGISCGWLFRVD